ncbi:nucleoside-diphosphate kinase [Candidatus Saccharibacteria bacterium]|nr:nucleoside-diphosphate kinase [Candidatus Saccharibacteria bacterium]MCB9821243.1 nucleoside-diphosphate kinase [Candidatus Nomurabacteria bacterium]
MVERTLILIKPDAVARGIIGEIITRFEKVGLKIIAAKMLVADEDTLSKHYPVERKEFIAGLGQKTLDNNLELGVDTKEVFGTTDAYKLGLEIQRWNAAYMQSGPLFAMVLEGPHAIETVRKIRGFTLPSKAQPGTITGDYSFDSSSLANASKRPIRNLVHASGNSEEAEFEVGLWFTPAELHDYQTIHQKFMME